MKKSLRLLSCLSLCFVIAGFAACASNPPAVEAPAPPHAETPAPAPKPPVSGAPGHVLAQLAAKLELSAEQQTTVAAVEKRFAEREAQRDARHQEHRKALAQSVRDGKLLQEDPEAISKQFASVRAETVTDLNLLHATLTAEQRKAVSTEFLAQLDRKQEMMRKHHQRAPHRHGAQDLAGPAVAGSAPAPAAPAASAPAAPTPSRFAELEASLALTAEQQAKLDAGLKAAAAPATPSAAAPATAAPATQPSGGGECKYTAMQQLRQLAEAFTQDTFDAGDNLPPADQLKNKHRHHEEFLTYLKVLVPVLTADQREKLAVHIETWHPHGCAGKCDGSKCSGGKCDGHHGAAGGCTTCSGCDHKDGKPCDHSKCDNCPDCKDGKCKHGDCQHKQPAQTL